MIELNSQSPQGILQSLEIAAIGLLPIPDESPFQRAKIGEYASEFSVQKNMLNEATSYRSITEWTSSGGQPANHFLPFNPFDRNTPAFGALGKTRRMILCIT